ncbi:MAG: hypothetical protein RLZZ15_997 [Verrucomicrobiota bacterium]|jgi:tetratricopeptide (TPR) repeat protein
MPAPTPKAIFLSYARDDAAAARRIAGALRGAGLDVWFDESELIGGDAWDQKIRTKIAECALFIPLLSANTQARLEGYFRLEWRLAEQRSHLMAKGKRFLVPVCIDATREHGAQVPDAFLEVQWTRLPAGETPPPFVELVQRLLAGEASRLSTPAMPGELSPERGAAKPGVPAAAWIGAVAVVGIGVGAIYWATRKSETPAAVAAAPIESASAPARPSIAPPPAAPLSEVRQLVADARALYEPWDLATPKDFMLAEQLLKKAVELAPTDGEAWAAYAILSCGQIGLNFDRSAERRPLARTQAEYAIKFAPESPLARFARAFSLRLDPSTRDEAIRLLREETVRQPTNRHVLRVLANCLNDAGQPDQALVYLDRAAALPGRDPIIQYNRGIRLLAVSRFDEAEAAFDEALAIAPNYMLANWAKLHFLLDVRGDLARARAQLLKVPAAFFLDERGAITGYTVALYMRDAPKCLEYLRRVKSDLGVVGPKAMLTAMAHRLAGNEEAARTDYQAGLKMVDDKLAAEPNNSDLFLHRANILASLGDRTAVEPMLREIRQRIDSGDVRLTDSHLAGLHAKLHRREEAIALLVADFGKPSKTYRSRIWIRYHPDLDPLRGDPRFEALLKVSETKK